MEIAMVILGWMTHHSLVLANMKMVKKSSINMLTWYISTRPFKFFSSVTLTIAAYLYLQDQHLLTMSSAFTAGLSAELVVDKLGSLAFVLKPKHE